MHHIPRSVLGDGNCMYRALSRGLFGTENQVGTTFDSWESFKVALDKYFQIRNMQFYCVNSRTVEAAKQLLTTTSAGKEYANDIK